MSVTLDLQLACASTDGLPTEAQLQGWLDGTILGFQEEAEEMEQLERDIMQELGFADPYLDDEVEG